MKTLYVHSLQSYLWNKIVSRRIQEFGIDVVVGDLVGKRKTGFEGIVGEVEEERRGGVQ
jgi:tRNA pseudouridine13 synthase